jgi:PAS domain S-box-containing protein
MKDKRRDKEYMKIVREHKKGEKTLHGPRDIESSILSAIPHAVIGLHDRKIIFANGSVESVFGWKAHELIGKSTRMLYRTDEDYEEIGRLFYPELEKQKTFSHEFTCRHKDGRDIPCRVSAAVIGATLQQGKIVVVYEDITDIAARKAAEAENAKLQTQLLHAQKMEAVGRLAGGIAHDFNNILTAIITYTYFLKLKIKKDDALNMYIDSILGSAERAAGLTRNLLAFSRKQILHPRPVNLNDTIESVEKILIRVLGEDIELKTLLSHARSDASSAENAEKRNAKKGRGDTIVSADPGQLEQVIMNLVTNARDAMPKGGKLTISTDIVEPDSEFVKTHENCKKCAYAVLSVSDTGVGMDESIKERIFEPFFTTKDIGRGTGLGLSMVYGIVKQHEGYIDVFSEKGKGTEFRIYLPAIQQACKDVKTENIASIKQGRETILLAEYNQEVRSSIGAILEEFGYKVIEAVDGDDMIEKFRKNKDRIQLMIVDVIMPKMNGRDAYEEVKKIKQGIKAIFISGYTADFIFKKGITEERFDFILKPVSPILLMKKVREMLDRQKTKT